MAGHRLSLCTRGWRHRADQQTRDCLLPSGAPLRLLGGYRLPAVFMNGRFPLGTTRRRCAPGGLAHAGAEDSAGAGVGTSSSDNMTVCPGGGGGRRATAGATLLFERIGQINGAPASRPCATTCSSASDGAAGETLCGALGYMARFRPTVGFSVEEARRRVRHHCWRRGGHQRSAPPCWPTPAAGGAHRRSHRWRDGPSAGRNGGGPSFL